MVVGGHHVGRPAPPAVLTQPVPRVVERASRGAVLTAATVNLWNRLNVATHQVAGQGW